MSIVYPVHVLCETCNSSNKLHAIRIIKTASNLKELCEYVNRHSCTALIYACTRKMSEVALALIATGHSKLDHITIMKDTALTIACYNKMSNVALALIATGQSKPEHVGYNDTALIYACYKKLPEVALALLKTGRSKPEQLDMNRKEWMYYAERSGILTDEMIEIALKYNDIDDIYEASERYRKDKDKEARTIGIRIHMKLRYYMRRSALIAWLYLN